MKKKDRRVLRQYLRDTADAMELRDWTVALDREYCTPDKMGHAHCIDGQRYVTVSVSTDFRTFTLEDQRETIVHELIHAHQEACWRMVQSDLSEPLGKVGYYVFADQYRRNMEYCVDALSKALARHLPLIDWPE